MALTLILRTMYARGNPTFVRLHSQFDLRAELIKMFAWMMLGILLLLFLVKLFKPDGLGGPPHPEAKDVKFKNSTISPS